jgi:hypothetical protein
LRRNLRVLTAHPVFDPERLPRSSSG